MSNYNNELFKVKPREANSNSTSASFCTVLGVIVLIGGLIVAIASANAGYGFSFTVFLVALIPYVVAGCMMFCLSELFQNIKSIATSLKELSVYGDLPRMSDASGSVKKEAIIANAKGREDAGENPPMKSSWSKSDGEKIVEKLKLEDREWVEADELGTLGEQLIAKGICRKETIYAPEGISSTEARAIGFTSWTLEDGKPRYWTMKNFVPKMTREELDELLAKGAQQE